MVTAQEYLAAFDTWLSQHIHAAMKSGKDLAFKERRMNFVLKLDDDGSAWDYVLLEPGARPPPGHAWSVYRLHAVRPPVRPAPEPPAAAPVSRRRGRLAGLVDALLGHSFAPSRAANAGPGVQLTI